MGDWVTIIIALVALGLAVALGYALRPDATGDAQDAAEAERARAQREAEAADDAEAWEDFRDKHG